MTSSQLRSRSKVSKEAEEDLLQQEQIQLVEKQKSTPPSTELPSSPPLSFSQKALASTAHLANLLPTGTLLAFQILTPVFTKSGSCDGATRLMTEALLVFLAASCFLACFTDSFKSSVDGRVHYGFVTPRGMWLLDDLVVEGSSSSSSANGVLLDLSEYRLRYLDFVHGMLSVLVFGVVALRDRDVVKCLYPQSEEEEKEVLDILPLGVGVICSMLFVIFPTRRHGIGYPVANGQSEEKHILHER